MKFIGYPIFHRSEKGDPWRIFSKCSCILNSLAWNGIPCMKTSIIGELATKSALGFWIIPDWLKSPSWRSCSRVRVLETTRCVASWGSYIPSARGDWRALDLQFSTVSNREPTAQALSRRDRCCTQGTLHSLEFIATHAWTGCHKLHNSVPYPFGSNWQELIIPRTREKHEHGQVTWFEWALPDYEDSLAMTRPHSFLPAFLHMSQSISWYNSPFGQ